MSKLQRNQDSTADPFTPSENQVSTQENVRRTAARSSYVPPVIVTSSPVQRQTLHQRDVSMMSVSTLEKFPDLPTSHPSPTRPIGPIQHGSMNALQNLQPVSFASHLSQEHTLTHYAGQNITTVTPIFAPGPPPNFPGHATGSQRSVRGGNRGRGQGRGWGRGFLPSLTPRHPPFPAQIGTPPSDAYAQYKKAHPDDFKSPEYEPDTISEIGEPNQQGHNGEPVNDGFYGPAGIYHNAQGDYLDGTDHVTQPIPLIAQGPYFNSYDDNRVAQFHHMTNMHYSPSQPLDPVHLQPYGAANMTFNNPAMGQPSTFGYTPSSHKPTWSYDPLVPYRGPSVRLFGSPSDPITMGPYVYPSPALARNPYNFGDRLEDVNTDVMTESEILALNKVRSLHKSTTSLEQAVSFPVPPPVTSSSTFPSPNVSMAHHGIYADEFYPRNTYASAFPATHVHGQPLNPLTSFAPGQNPQWLPHQNTLQQDRKPTNLGFSLPNSRQPLQPSPVMQHSTAMTSRDPRIQSAARTQHRQVVAGSTPQSNSATSQVVNHLNHSQSLSSREFNPLFTSPTANKAISPFRPPANANSPPKGTFLATKRRSQPGKVRETAFALMTEGSVDISVAAAASAPGPVNLRRKSSAAGVKFGFGEHEPEHEHNNCTGPEADEGNKVVSRDSSAIDHVGWINAASPQSMQDSSTTRMLKRQQNKHKEIKTLEETKKKAAEKNQLQRADREARAARRAVRKSGEKLSVEAGETKDKYKDQNEDGQGDAEEKS